MGLDTLSIWSLRGWQCTLPAELVSYPRVRSLSSPVLLFSSTFQTSLNWLMKRMKSQKISFCCRECILPDWEKWERDLMFTECVLHARQSTGPFNLILMTMLSLKFLGFFFFGVCLFFCHAHSMQKSLSQGLNLSHSSDNTKSLTTRPPGNSSKSYYCQVRSWDLKKLRSLPSHHGSSHRGSAEMNSTSIHKDAGLIPGLSVG